MKCPLLTAAVLFTLFVSTPWAHAHGVDQSQAPIGTSVSLPLDATTRGRLPSESVTASSDGRELACEGVSLTALLQAAGAMSAQPLRGGALASYVLVTARDGYRAVYSLAELDPTLGANPVMLVDRCNGKPLDGDVGPLRLVAAKESRPARWVRQVESIVVVAAP